MTYFLDALAAQRETLNAQFAAARVNRPGLDGTAFLAVLGECVAPTAEAACSHDPERAEAITASLYRVALDLFLGGAFRQEGVRALWTRVLPQLAPLVATRPQPIAAALSNAVLNLEATPGARLEEWLARVLQAAAHTRDSDLFLRAGQVAAWRSGMAHYREGALRVARTLPDPVAQAALSLPEAAAVASTLKRLSANPWYDPLAGDAAGTHLYRLGGFRGFGGPFIALPVVGLLEGQLAVQSGVEVWRVFADSFGATLKRAATSEVARQRAGGSVSPLAILAQPVSTAQDGQRVAVTTLRSYFVFVTGMSP